MILKKIFTNGNQRNTDIGNSYLLVEKDKAYEQFLSIAGEELTPAEKERELDHIVAFIVYNEGEETPKKIERCYAEQYNAIMSQNGAIYHVITCMPD